MYSHHEQVTGAFPAFLDQALLDAILTLVRRSTPGAVRMIAGLTDDQGQLGLRRTLEACERALTSPRRLRALFAG
jgi:hypothetical protein